MRKDDEGRSAPTHKEKPFNSTTKKPKGHHLHAGHSRYSNRMEQTLEERTKKIKRELGIS